ncbi:hypothetical protein [Flavobacterium daemonense]|uniref:hypothetical protein n=1 Tax=Flavobacterium daemonense TaxID=1393049 RepID=UPI0013A611A0|nr:hypothetical protein [Flavobacterium daemonense]KAF2336933.1 hypothetical protein FND99_00570 [Flavobacterium daemonense]
MKHLYSKILVAVFLVFLINYGSAPHCDDEDYTHGPKEALHHQTNTLSAKIDY